MSLLNAIVIGTEESFRQSVARALAEKAGLAIHYVSDVHAAYPWPGNVRELRNVMERAVVLCSGVAIAESHLPKNVRQGGPQPHVSPGPPQSSPNPLAQARQQAEFHELLITLKRHQNNRSSTAADLGISRVALYKKLRKHGLQ